MPPSCTLRGMLMSIPPSSHRLVSKILGAPRSQTRSASSGTRAAASHRLASKILRAISDPETFLKDQLKLHAVDTLELCLVCEVCWRPQRDGAYDVTKKSDLCAKVRVGPPATRPQLRGISFDI